MKPTTARTSPRSFVGTQCPGRQTDQHRGKPHVVSEKLQFAAIDKTGNATNAGIAPHLNLRPAKPEEIKLAEDKLNEDWLRHDLEKAVVRFATVELAQTHVADVKARCLPEIKVEREVMARLKKEINYWDNRAAELRVRTRRLARKPA